MKEAQDIIDLKERFEGYPGAQRLIGLLGRERDSGNNLLAVSATFGEFGEKGLCFGGQKGPDGNRQTAIECLEQFASDLPKTTVDQRQLFDSICAQVAAGMEAWGSGEPAYEDITDKPL